MAWSCELPPELVCRPTGLVVLTGLDVTYNAIHKSIWDSFYNNRRPDRVPLQFQVCDGDHEYPKCRTKRTSYEWYIPKGILKTSWMNKHLTQVPAVVVVFFDLDWDETMWKERQMECATRIEIVRNSLHGRGTRVAVVLIQKNAPLPPGEDVMAAERAASFCSACDLSAKSLFVLPHTDHLIGYTIRLENAFYELAQGYYHSEARKVKAHKDFLNKTNHQLLFVRHQFKVAFFSELKQDTHTAIKHYKQAYGHILELRMHDNNLLEIKTIAGFINYKICRLSFQHNAPLDAIAQFRKHIDFFKNKTGTPELAFEHSAWMSKQFQVFGDLFDEAIKLGLTAIQTQHPGFYYQQAGNHAIARKQLCRGLCHPLTKPLSPDPLENLNNLDYYGQRPWRQGHQSIEPPDSQTERDGVLALQHLETQVDHSWLIIPLLSSAVAQFKKYKSARMKRYLMVQMGEEYYHARDYTKALTLLGKVTWDYRQERWWLLLTSILEVSLKCAYLIAKVQDYVTVCLELIGQYSTCAVEEKTRVQMNLIRVMSGATPEPEPGLEAGCVEAARSAWGAQTNKQDLFSVDMQNIIPFVECKSRFTAESFAADGEISIEVYLRTSCQFPLRFARLSVNFNNQLYNQYCVVTDGQGISAASEGEGGSADLYLIPGQTKLYTFTFLPVKEDVGGQVEIVAVALELGSESHRRAVLRWQGAGGESVTSYIAQPHPSPKNNSQALPSWEVIKPSSLARIVPRGSKMLVELKHQAPSLLNEFYPVQVVLTNQETLSISDIRLTFGVLESTDSAIDQTTHICEDSADFDGTVVSRRCGLSLGALQPGEQTSKWFYLKCLQTGVRNVEVKVVYNVEVSPRGQALSCSCFTEENISLSTVVPFELSVKLMSVKFENIEVVHSNEAFLAIPEIRCTSPWQLEMGESQLSVPDQVVIESFQSQVKGVSLKKSECAAECICLSVSDTLHASVNLGSLTLHWKRHSAGDEIPLVSTTLPLPTVTIEHIPISVNCDVPAFGSVKSLLPLGYCVENRTAFLQDVEITLEPNDNFMFAGNKQVHFRVLPNSTYSLTYNLYPLTPGHVTLPRLHVNMSRFPGSMDDVILKMLPSHIFIKPRAKEPALTA
ncbi:trafficking protein particle complex subunit 11-like [Liolophura sinensis]|uniref:trafficking protein particle complex subunit 11-like n=1 Tax=Liolophura sinensis TaxID=3198878 RepID=UPI003158AC3D